MFLYLARMDYSRLFSILMQGLAHQLRTPLSVISNDLSYFKTKLGDGDCVRSAAKVREISNILKDLALIENNTQQELTCSDLRKLKLFSQTACYFDAKFEEFCVTLPLQKFRHAVDVIDELIVRYFQPKEIFAEGIVQSERMLTLHAQNVRQGKTASVEPYDSLSLLLSEQYGCDVAKAVLCDLYFDELPLTVSYSFGDDLVMRMLFEEQR